MRVLRLLPFVFMFSIPVLAQTTQQAQGDPQAIAVVQASITALGGAEAIDQVKSWTFDATMQGPKANGRVTYTIDTQRSKLTFKTNKGTEHAILLRSFFVPAVVGSILTKEFQDTNVSMQYKGLVMVNSEPVTTLTFSVHQNPNVTDQIWYFDANSIPVKIEFLLPAELGSKASFAGVVDLSDYRPVAGLKYPFQIVTKVHNALHEVIAIQSITPSSVLPTSQAGPNTQAGDSL